MVGWGLGMGVVGAHGGIQVHWGGLETEGDRFEGGLGGGGIWFWGGYVVGGWA